jgi:hypothetical protein
MPTMSVKNYDAFPAIRIYKDEEKDFNKAITYNDAYDVFITSFKTLPDWNIGYKETIYFKNCSTIDNAHFQDYMLDYLELYDYLCPETGNIDFNGSSGTQMWVVPKNNSDEFDIRIDPTPYLNTSVDMQMITKDFIM